MALKAVQKPKIDISGIPPERLGMWRLGCVINILVYTEGRAFYEAMGVDVDRRITRLSACMRAIDRDPRYRGEAEPYGA